MSATTPDPDFRALERAGWEAVAGPYAAAWPALTAQTIEPLLDGVGAAPGTSILDVATGPGHVAAAAARRGAHAVGVDLSAAMVAEAQARFPEATFREGDAEALPLDDGRFDAVVANFGLLHFADPARALREARRVLRPGGRVGFTVWSAPEAAVAFRLVLDAVQACGDPQAPLPAGPPFFHFSEPATCQAALLAAGFAAPAIEPVAMTWSLPSPAALYDVMAHATVRIAALLRAQAPEARGAIRAHVSRHAAAFERGGVIAIPMSAVLAVAVAS